MGLAPLSSDQQRRLRAAHVRGRGTTPVPTAQDPDLAVRLAADQEKIIAALLDQGRTARSKGRSTGVMNGGLDKTVERGVDRVNATLAEVPGFESVRSYIGDKGTPSLVTGGLPTGQAPGGQTALPSPGTLS